MDPLQTLRSVRRRWRILVALVTAGVFAGYLSASIDREAAPVMLVVTRFAATHTLIADTTGPNANPNLYNLSQLAQRVTKGEILSDVAAGRGKTATELAPHIRVTIHSDSQTFELTAFAERADDAVALADAFATSTTDRLAGESATRYADQLAAAQKRATDAEANLAAVRRKLVDARAAGASRDDLTLLESDETLYGNLRLSASADLVKLRADGPTVVPITTLQAATPIEISEGAYLTALALGDAGANIFLAQPGKDEIGFVDSTPRRAGVLPSDPFARGGFGAAVGLFLAVALVLLIDRFDPRLRSKADVESLLGLPVVAEIPPLSRRQRRRTDMLARDEPLSRHAESYRVLRSSIDFAIRAADETGDGPACPVVLVSSPGPSEGKTTSVANLACVLAESGRRVLVVNCDFRRPRVQRFLHSDDRPEQVHDTDVDGVRLITHVLEEGPGVTPGDVVAAQRRVIERARTHFDIVLLDTAPLLTTNDAAEVLAVADHVVVVVNAGRTTRDAAARAVEMLERRGAPMIGVALVGARDLPRGAYYYYEGGDGYLRSSSRRSTAATPPSAPPRPRRDGRCHTTHAEVDLDVSDLLLDEPAFVADPTTRKS